MKFNKTTVLNFADKCKSILASNWQCQLNTVTTEANGSKGDICTSTLKYITRKGKPYIWVPEKDIHNVNAAIDERGSISVTNPFPGQLRSLLKSIQKPPARVAMVGDVLRHKDEQSAVETLKEFIQLEQQAISESSYAVSEVLSSSDVLQTSHSENLKELLEGDTKYNIYTFNPRSCIYVDFYGNTQQVDLEGLRTSKTDRLAPFSAQIIDGINQSEARRRALILFCITYLNTHVKDAYMMSLDRKGFTVLGKISTPGFDEDGFDSVEYNWREYRFSLAEEANDVESFCQQLVEMEEEAVNEVSEFSGLG